MRVWIAWAIYMIVAASLLLNIGFYVARLTPDRLITYMIFWAAIIAFVGGIIWHARSRL